MSGKNNNNNYVDDNIKNIDSKNEIIVDPPISENQNFDSTIRSVLLYVLGFTVAIGFSDLMVSVFNQYFSKKYHITSKFVYVMLLMTITIILTVFWK